MTAPQFIHLRVHSDYSMVDGLAKTDKLVKFAAGLDFPAMAITDFTNLCGLVKFYSTSLQQGIKPIIGADIKVKSEQLENDFFDLTVLAMDQTGYHNLIMLISDAYKQGYIGDGPVVLQQWLTQYHQGLIILAGRQSDIGQFLLRENNQQAEECVHFYRQWFADRFYFELVRTGRSNEERFITSVVQFAETHHLPVVATNDVRFLSENDYQAHDIRVAIHQGFTLADPNRPQYYNAQQYFRSEQEMCKLFADIPEALANSVEIAKRCNVTIRLGEYFLPQFPTGDMSTDDFLVQKSKQGLEERLLQRFPDHDERQQHRSEYDQRLDLELQTVNQMGFPGYFLIVMEFIQWAKENDIPVGPGRGSGAGSLVAYALKITDLDPLEFDLLFERFLNPERVSMPDFDIDFCMENRDAVIDHVAEMYGRDAVSQIITFGTMAAKAVIRDVGRVLQHPYGFVDRIAKLIPMDPGMTLEKAFQLEPQLQAQYDSNEEVKELIDFARQLEGVTRNAGKHAGGVVISPTKITDFSPIYCDPEGLYPVTQFDKNDVEYAGLVKFDFLGLRTLTIIDWALQMVNETRIKNNQEPIKIDTIPLDDPKCFEVLKRAETTAIFQLESRGMKDLIKRLQPDCFEDMIALVALFRPGPLQSGMVDNFIDRKHGREAISYPDSQYQHESLKTTLEPTYGIILYQEQVMQIAQILAGYSLGGADLLRRAMGKKKPEEMAQQRSIFEDGAKEKGVDGQLAMKIFDLVEKFAGYGFNKSHSAAYALVSYQTLWLKVHYPAEFMAAVMTADMDNTDKIIGLVDECKNMGLTVTPPDINRSRYRFHVDEQGEIVYGLGAIKGIGEGPSKEMIAARERDGYFKELFDLCARIDVKRVGKRVFEKLVMSGALDCLGPHRAALMHTLNEAIHASEQHHKAESLGQTDMFGVLAETPEHVERAYAIVRPYTEQEILDGERETLGFYLTGHPVTQYLKELDRYTSGLRLNEIVPTERNKLVTVAGYVVSSKVIVTKKGTRIGIATLDDSTGCIDIMLFSEALEHYQHLLVKDRILIASGQILSNEDYGGFKMTVRELLDVSEAREKYVRGLAISLVESQVNDTFLQKLHAVLLPKRGGSVPIHLYYQKENARLRLKFGTIWRVTPDESLLVDLRKLIDQKQVELEFD